MVKNLVITQKPNDLLKNLVANIPLITLYILIFGIIKQLLFYRNFHLPIKYFLGLTEIGLIVSDDLIISVITILLSSIISYLLMTNSFKRKSIETYSSNETYKTSNTTSLTERIVANTDRINKIEDYVNRLETQQNLEITQKKRVQKIMKISGIIISITSFFLIIYVDHYYNKLFCIVSLLIGILLSISHLLINWLKDAKVSILSFYVYNSSFLLIITLILNTGTELINVESGKYNNTLIVTSDSTYTSTASNYFIGRTEKYVFIYNVKDTSTTIIPTESIKKITLKMK